MSRAAELKHKPMWEIEMSRTQFNKFNFFIYECMHTKSRKVNWKVQTKLLVCFFSHRQYPRNISLTRWHIYLLRNNWQKTKCESLILFDLTSKLNGKVFVLWQWGSTHRAVWWKAHMWAMFENYIWINMFDTEEKFMQIFGSFIPIFLSIYSHELLCLTTACHCTFTLCEFVDDDVKIGGNKRQ